MRVVKVAEFTKFPGPRYKKLGSFSGEEFRDEILLPLIRDSDTAIRVDLDNVFGYGSSFLEETFGGLVRAGVDNGKLSNLIANLKSDDEPELVNEIKKYIEEEQAKCQK